VDDDEVDGEDADDEVPVEPMQGQAVFDSVTVWEHEMQPPEDDVFARGLEEWIGFAARIHSTTDATERTTKS
jgi:ribonuclease H2 subunit C